MGDEYSRPNRPKGDKRNMFPFDVKKTQPPPPPATLTPSQPVDYNE